MNGGCCRPSQLRESLALCVCAHLHLQTAKLWHVQGRACIWRHTDVFLTSQGKDYVCSISWMTPLKSPGEELMLQGGLFCICKFVGALEQSWDLVCKSGTNSRRIQRMTKYHSHPTPTPKQHCIVLEWSWSPYKHYKGKEVDQQVKALSTKPGDPVPFPGRKELASASCPLTARLMTRHIYTLRHTCPLSCISK